MKQTAIEAARLAANIQLKNLGSITGDDVDHKQQFDFITHVDRESENAIIELIHKRFPEHAIFAEESSKDNAIKDYRWIIDPLDGTTNYIHAYPVFSVSIALEYKGEIVLGVVFDPTRNDLFYAEKGKGAFLNDERIKVSQISDPGHCLLTTGFPFRCKELLELYLESFRRLFLTMSGIRRVGSAALDFAYLACGRCDGFWELDLSPWDVAAGSLLIQEARGMITDFSGGNEYIWIGNVIASNGKIHNHILEIVSDVFNGTVIK
jgi:myo-inositol-1(or 4)-monophosphatase